MTASKLPTQTVIHVVNGLAFGGTEALCLQLIRHTPPHIQHQILNLNPNCQDMRSQFEDAGASIVNVAYRRKHRLRSMRQWFHFFRKEQPNAVISHVFGLHLFVGLAARLAGVSVLAVGAGNPVPEDEVMRRKWRQVLWGSCRLNIPIYSGSHTIHTSLSQLGSLPKGSDVIPYGCDVEAIASRSQKTRQSRSDRPIIIGMVARLNAIKDQATLIQAFAQVHETDPQTRLWLVGDGDERSRLETLADQLGIAAAITFWGDRSDVPELLGQMHLYAFSTTEDEGFGIALIEAMAAALPIVASDVSAGREVLENGKAGLLVTPDSPDAIAQVLKNWIADPDQRQHWAARAHHHVLRHYDIRHCAHTWYRHLHLI
jgi:glycosyltransferase involved in cell wall biosynthesis